MSPRLVRTSMKAGKQIIQAASAGHLLAIGDDLLQNILSRLPAISYCRAASTCRTFHKLCNRILNHPKLPSALSLKHSLEDALEEVFDKVLSQPIRPHFVIAWIGRKFNLNQAHELIKARFGPLIPIVTCLAQGIIGEDVATGDFLEVKWCENDIEEDQRSYNSLENIDCGVVLVVGFTPGVKISAMSMKKVKKRSEREVMVDSFLSDVKSYARLVSGSTSPLGVLMFVDKDADVRFVLERMDDDLAGETIIAGEQKGHFLFSNGDDITNVGRNGGTNRNLDAVGLVFVAEGEKPQGLGEIHLHLVLSNGLSPLGPMYRAASVRASWDSLECTTWLTATREGSLERLDGQTIVADVDHEIGDDDGGDFYIGVRKRRRFSAKSGKWKLSPSFAFHAVTGADEEYLFVEGDGIRTGDRFRCYLPNVETALASHGAVAEDFKLLKTGWAESSDLARTALSANRTESVFGGLIFSCCGRGESFYGNQNVDSSVFLENFPNTPLAGIFCGGEIGRGPSLKRNINGELDPSSTCLHVYSTVYVLMSYVPRSGEE